MRDARVFVFDGFELDVQKMELRRDGMLVAVQPRVLQTLIHLVRHRDRAVSKEELIQGPWGGTVVTDGALNQAISLIRLAVKDDGKQQSVIKTVRGHGFRFVAAVREVSSDVDDDSFVGRSSELRELRERFADAERGRGSIVLIEGGPGVGKTSLVERAVAEQASTTRAHWGRSSEDGGATPFSIWSQALGSLARDMALPELAELYRVIPSRTRIETIDTLPELPEGEVARREVRSAVTRLLVRAASKQPVLLVFEDLHAADEPSLLLIEALCEHVADARLLVIGTFRDTELAAGHPLRRRLDGALGKAARIRLDGLGTSETRKIIGRLLGSSPDDETSSLVADLTGGNPFFIEQLIRAAKREGGIAGVSAALRADRVPERLAEVIRRGLAKVPGETSDVLSAGAVLGREFDLGLVSAIVWTSTEEVLDRLEIALVHGWLREVSVTRFAFTHAVVRATLYEDLSPATRARLHRQAAVALVERSRASADVAVEQIAHHYFLGASTGCVGEAIQFAIEAARDAQQRTAYEEAVFQLERALTALDLGQPNPGMRIDILVELGRSLRCAGDHERARCRLDQAYGLARSLGDVSYAARVVDAYADSQQGLLDFSLVERLREVLADLPDEDSILRARVLARVARATCFVPMSGADELAQEAVAMAERLGDATTQKIALVSFLWALRRASAPAERLEIAERAVRAAVSTDDLGAACEARVWVIDALLALGRPEAFTVAFSALEAESRSLRQAFPLCIVARFRVVRAMLEGRFSEAEKLAAQAREFGYRIGDQVTDVVFWIQSSLLLRESGRLGELETVVRQMIDFAPWDATWRCFLPIILLETGRVDEARRVFEELATDDFAGIASDMNWLVSMSHLAEVSAALGDVPRAKVLYRLLAAHRAEHVVVAGGSLYRGPVLRYLGLLSAAEGRWDDALRELTGALAALKPLGARGWAAHVEAEIAATERKR